MSKELVEQLRTICRHDSFSVAGCCTCESADRIEELGRELADALDCKSGAGPSALSMVLTERDQLREQVARSDQNVIEQKERCSILKNNMSIVEEENDQLREHVKLLQSAIKNLRDVKGRHHSEIAYKRLIEALAATKKL